MKKIISALLSISLMASIVPAFAAQNELNPDTSTWFVYEYPKAADVAGTPLDASNLLDAPAGKHGFLTGTDGQRFVFEDGTDIRFNGINLSLSAPYMNYPDATEAAARIAQSGYNIVRFHCLEGGYREAIWGRKTDGGRVLKDEIMDRTCFFMSELKKRGVYYLLDLTVSMPPLADMPFNDYTNLEDLNSAFKKFSYYDEDLIEVTKDIASQLLNYYNPYVGTRIKDDPALALIDTKNEDFISTIVSSEEFGSKGYEAKLQAKFNQWLRDKYGTDDALRAAWQRNYDPDVVSKTRYTSTVTGKYTTEDALLSTESLTNGSVRVFHDEMYPWDEPAYADGREADRALFLDMVQREYFAEMIDYLRNDLGVKCRITGVTGFTTTGRTTQMLHTNIDTDFVDSHSYTALGSSHNYQNEMVMNEPEVTMLRHDRYSILGESFAYSAYGVPHTITEWNHTAPDRYRAESMVIMPAFSSLHSMHPFGFTWVCNEVQQDFASITTDNFKKASLTFSEAPETLAGMPNAARIFLREDVRESDKAYYPFRYIGNEAYLYDQRTLDSNDQYDFLRDVGLVGKSGNIFDERYEGPDAKYSVNDVEVLYHTRKGQKSGQYLSATGEILSDVNANILKVNTQKTQAVTGEIGGKEIELSDIKLTVDNPFATITYSAINDKPLYQSSGNLLTVIGDSRNTGMVMSLNEDGKIVITEAGTNPVLVEPITGTVVIKTNNNITVYPLTSSGKRQAAKQVTPVDGGKSFTMEAADKAMHYEIVIENAQAATQLSPVSLGSTSVPALYTDIAGNTYKREIENVMLHTDIWTAEGSSFNPNGQITKKDFCMWLIRALRLTEEDRGIKQTDLSASDLSSGAAGYTEMSIAYTLGAISTRTEGSWIFKRTYVDPNTGLSRGDAMQIASKILQRSYRDKAANSDHGAFMVNNGYVDSLGDTGAALTRAEAARIIYNIMWAK